MEKNRKKKIVKEKKIVVDVEKYWKCFRRIIVISFVAGIMGGIFSFKKEMKEEAKAAYYEIQPRDSINKIARKFKVLPWQLRLANGIEADEEIIRPGQILIIPRPKWVSYYGKASWYGRAFHGKKTASGEIFDQNKISVAHRTLPFWTEVKITNVLNGLSVVAPVLDRGPYFVDEKGRYKREIDLSFAAAEALDAVEKGEVPVLIEPLPSNIIRG